MACGGKRNGGGSRDTTDVDPVQLIRDCEAVLNRPDTDWDAIYLRLRCSPIGSDFPRERFLCTPIATITRALEYIDNEEKRLHNISASTTAKLCLQVISIAQGMAGSKSKLNKLELKHFLPFPDWSPKKDSAQGPSEHTRTILASLLRQGQIPMPVYAQLITPPEASR